MPNIATPELSGRDYAQYEYSFNDLISAWPEFKAPVTGRPPVSGAAAQRPGTLCPGVIPLKRS